MFDVFTYSLAPGYLNYLGSQCQCDPTNPLAFFNWLSEQKALYIAEAPRYDLTETYMNIIHHQKIKFTASGHVINAPCISSTNMKDYEIRAVTIENQ